MTFWIPLTCLGASVVALILLIIANRAGWGDADFYYPLGLCVGLVLGISAFFLGLTLFSTDNAWWVACGMFLLVSGLQITLWALGIRLDILGNQSTAGGAGGLLPLAGSFFLEEPRQTHTRFIAKFLEEFYEDLTLFFSRGIRDRRDGFLDEIVYVLKYPESNSNFIPLLRDIVAHMERLKLQSTALEVGIFREQTAETQRVFREQIAETQGELIEAIANFRAEFNIRYPYM